ncbi:MAG TPA: HAMP domain-containing sensor histidine kinase [Candidatus Dormibacteraeota bacterium]|nr:HAMP domain-containing sensor histidine kinase [Candidatus Dormibacteraeota bacterium]
MLMSLAFSFVLYNVSAKQLERQLPPTSFYSNQFGFNGFRPTLDIFLRERIEQAHHELLIKLLVLNLGTLGAGSLFSYWLARRSLQPIEAAIEGQSQFVSDASHELRTPLTAIQTSNEVALRKPHLSLPEAKQVIAQNIEEVIKLRQLSDGLLHLARNDGRHLLLKAVSIQDAAGEAMNQILNLAQAKEISIDDQIPNIKALAYKPSLIQIIVILLDNAIKYSHPKSSIVLSAESKGKFVYLRVQDSGVGIRAGDLPHIFKRFYRVDPSRSKDHYDGYGLGLSIADKLVREQQGEILVTAKPGFGSTFSIKLLAIEEL